MSAVAATASTAGGQPPQAHQAAQIPFIVGSDQYREAPFFTQVFTPAAVVTARQFQVTPGNFLRGITIQITGTGGVLGAGSLSTNNTTPAANGVLDLIGGITLTDTGGAPIIYPIGLFTAAMIQKYFLWWLGDPQTRAVFQNVVTTPAVTVNLRVEARDTLGVLANTDARAQYRLAYVENPLLATTNNPGLTATAITTAPTCTVKGYIDSWSQPDQVDLMGAPIAQVPDGLVCSRFIMREQPTVNSGNNVIRFTLTGNEIRCLMLIFRDALGKRTDLSDANAGNLRFRIDNRVIWTMTATQLVEEMTKFYPILQLAQLAGTPQREAGVYVIPFCRDPGDLKGDFWMQTVEQSLLQLEFTAAVGDFAGGLPGTVELIYDQLAIAPGAMLPPQLEGV